MKTTKSFIKNSLSKILFCSVVLFIPFSIIAQSEICNNGIDDDNDGLIDCFDTDCCDDNSCDNFWYPACPPLGCSITDNNTIPVERIDLNASFSLNTMQHIVSGDLDGDGINEIICTTENVNSGGAKDLMVFNSATGDLLLRIELATDDIFHRIAIGDLILSNSTAEILVYDGGVKCYDLSGTLLWSYDNTNGERWDCISLADFNQDGLAEVYGGNSILSGQNGSVLIDLPEHNFLSCLKPAFAVEILEDSDCSTCNGLEYIFDQKLYSVDILTGQVELISSAPNIEDIFSQMAIADWDLDGDLDVIIKYRENLTVSDLPNWNIIAQGSVKPAFGGNLNIGNLDDDSSPELCMIQADTVYAFDNDLSILWKAYTDDQSAKTGLSMFDFDGDGSNEVITRDEENLRILSGIDGSIVTLSNCGSVTFNEKPIIIDSDRDGEAEIITICNSGIDIYDGILTKFVASPGTKWSGTRPVWNQSNFFNTHINDDLSIPQFQQEHHLLNDLNTFDNPIALTSVLQFDFEIEGVILNFGDCQMVLLSICNQGVIDYNDDLQLSFYNSTTSELIEVSNIEINLEVGQCFNYEVEVAFDENVEFFTAIINDSGILPPDPLISMSLPNTVILECDYQNNILSFIPVLNQELITEIQIGDIIADCDMAVIPGPDGNYNYLWSTNENTQNITVTSSGVYTVTVTDNCGNTGEDSVDLMLPSCNDEICDNGIDDDGDGLIDCEDSDCCGEMGCADILPDFSLPNTFIVLPDCQTLFLNICNDGAADFSGLLSISIYDGIPEFPGADLVTTFQEMVIVNAGDCSEVPVDISTISDLDTYYIFLNDNGSLVPPFIVNDNFPITDIHECDFQNNLGFYNPLTLPAVEVEVGICPGENFTLPDGEMVSMAGTYIDTLSTAFACDSIIMTTIEILTDCVVEDCNNGIDDDGDGLIDVFDPDCDCIKNFIIDSGFDNYPDCCFNINCLGNDEWVRAGGGATELYQPNCNSPFPFGGILNDDNFAAGGFNYNTTQTGEAELMGTCLKETLLAGNEYTFSIEIGGAQVDELVENFEVLVMGITDCDNILDYRPLPSMSMCSVTLPREELVRINLFGLEEGWNSVSVNFTPTTDIEAIFFSPACDHIPLADQYNYVFYDDIKITPAAVTSLEVTGSLCADNIIISVPDDPTASYTWYLDSIEITGEISSTIDLSGTNVSGDHQYHLNIVLPNGECELIGQAVLPDAAYDSEEDIILCNDQDFIAPDGSIIDTAGEYIFMLTANDGCDSVAMVNLSYHPMFDFMFGITTDCDTQSLEVMPNSNIADIILDGESYGTLTVIDDIVVGMHVLEFIDINGCSYINDFEITDNFVDYAITLDDASFDCQTISGEVCWENLLPNTLGNDVYFYAYNSQSEELELIDIFNLQFNQNDDCSTFLALVSTFDFTNFDQFLVVINAANEVMSTDELEDSSNYFNECAVTDNYAFLDFQTQSLNLGNDVEICDTAYLILGPGGFATYEWSTGSDEQNLLVNISGEYILTATDLCDRTFIDTINVTLDQIGMVTADLQFTCNGFSNGSIEINVADTPAEDLDYTWEDNIGIGNIAMDLPFGEYMVTITNGLCEEIVVFEVLETPPATFVVLQSAPLCFGSTDGMIEIQSTQNIQSIILENQEYAYPIIFQDLSAGTYDLTIIDEGGCEQEVQVVLEELPAIDASIIDTFLLAIFEEQQLQLSGNIPEDAMYQWSPSTVLSCTSCPDPIFIGSQSTTINVALTVQGCTEEYSVFLDVDDDLDVYIPNIFNPDSQSGNDTFGAFTPLNFESTSMWIYDRWGNRVYSSENADELNYWDGSFKQEPVEIGVYVYMIQIQLSSDRVLQYEGNVTVLR